MSLQIYSDNDGGFRLHRQDVHVGWVEGRAIGFRGFESSNAALRAANAGYDALRAWLARERRTEQLPAKKRALRTRRDGSQTAITLDGSPIGRIVTLPGESQYSEPEFGFELTLPPQVGTVAGISAAQVMHNAMHRQEAVPRKALESAGA